MPAQLAWGESAATTDGAMISESPVPDSTPAVAVSTSFMLVASSVMGTRRCPVRSANRWSRVNRRQVYTKGFIRLRHGGEMVDCDDR